MKQGIYIIILCSVIILPGCKGKSKSSEPGNFVHSQEDASNLFPEGSRIYHEKCAVCHMLYGEGVKGIYPPLAGSDYLMKDPGRAIDQIIYGINEQITVNGVNYSQPMPAQNIDRAGAVAVINFIINSWGNQADTLLK